MEGMGFGTHSCCMLGIVLIHRARWRLYEKGSYPDNAPLLGEQY